MEAKRCVTFGICQMVTIENKEANLERAREMIIEATQKGADIIVLPEMFNCPYEKEFFEKFKENMNDTSAPSIKFLRDIAIETKKWIIGGSILEIDDEGKYYNTSLVYNPHGELVAKHRKVHMFDIDVPGQYHKESDIVTPGNTATVFDTPYGKIGLGICYDIRFAEFSLLMRDKGADILVFPANFNATTGALHYELLAKGRALDTQTFVVMVAPARDLTQKTGYMTWAHSLVVSPNGCTLAQAELVERLLIVELDLKDLERQRTGFPFASQRRNDIYKLIGN